MTLDANGVLMVGSTTPGSDRVRIKASNTTGSSVYSYLNCTNEIDSDLQIRITGSAATDKRAVITTTTNTPIAFGTNDTERGRFTAGGDFLVGKTGTDPTVGAGTIIGLAGATAGALFCTKTETANTSSTLGVYSTGAAAYRFYVGMAGTVYATNTTISAISDQRFKENIQDLDVGLDAILALKPRKFDWKEGKGKDIKGDRGFIAQEIAQVFPDLVDEWKDPAPEGEEPYKSVRQDLIPVLVKAIQELTARVAALESK
jgi:hypothetical protein